MLSIKILNSLSITHLNNLPLGEPTRNRASSESEHFYSYAIITSMIERSRDKREKHNYCNDDDATSKFLKYLLTNIFSLYFKFNSQERRRLEKVR